MRDTAGDASDYELAEAFLRVASAGMALTITVGRGVAARVERVLRSALGVPCLFAMGGRAGDLSSGGEDLWHDSRALARWRPMWELYGRRNQVAEGEGVAEPRGFNSEWSALCCVCFRGLRLAPSIGGAFRQVGVKLLMSLSFNKLFCRIVWYKHYSSVSSNIMSALTL